MEGKQFVANQTLEVRDRQAKKGNKICKANRVSSESIPEDTSTASSAQVDFIRLTEQTNAGVPAQVGSAHLEVEVAARLLEVASTESSSARGERCLEALRTMMQQLGPDWGALPFGSFANGFSTVYSDLDVTCCQVGKVLGDDAQQQAVATLWSCLPLLQMHPAF